MTYALSQLHYVRSYLDVDNRIEHCEKTTNRSPVLKGSEMKHTSMKQDVYQSQNSGDAKKGSSKLEKTRISEAAALSKGATMSKGSKKRDVGFPQ